MKFNNLSRKSFTDVNEPRRITFRMIIPKIVSIWFSHELCFGRYTNRIRGKKRDTREEAGQTREEAGQTREEAGQTREEAGQVRYWREEAGQVRREEAGQRESGKKRDRSDIAKLGDSPACQYCQ